MAGEKILIVDDEKEICELIAKYLKKEGFVTQQVNCGTSAIEAVRKSNFNLVVLDIMMSDMDGFDVIQIIRREKPYLPVMFLSARQEDYDKILGFGLGADDYVTKPFSPAELTARIKAHLKRIQAYHLPLQKSEKIVIGELCLDLKSFTLIKNGNNIDLSAREIKLLQLFMENPERVYTKTQIYNQVWENDFGDDNSVMVYISHLRDKLEDDPRNPQYIQTVRGIGYKLKGN